jgi:hypothetical protein
MNVNQRDELLEIQSEFEITGQASQSGMPSSQMPVHLRKDGQAFQPATRRHAGG